MGAPSQRLPSPPHLTHESCLAKPASPAQCAVQLQAPTLDLAVSPAATRHWKVPSCLMSSLPCKLLQREVSDDAARWTVCFFSVFGRQAKDLTDFQLALQHINYVGVWSIWQEDSPTARVQTRWPEAPVFIRTRGAVRCRQERLRGHPRWRKVNLQPRWRVSPERGWGGERLIPSDGF